MDEEPPSEILALRREVESLRAQLDSLSRTSGLLSPNLFTRVRTVVGYYLAATWAIQSIFIMGLGLAMLLSPIVAVAAGIPVRIGAPELIVSVLLIVVPAGILVLIFNFWKVWQGQAAAKAVAIGIGLLLVVAGSVIIGMQLDTFFGS